MTLSAVEPIERLDLAHWMAAALLLGSDLGHDSGVYPGELSYRTSGISVGRLLTRVKSRVSPSLRDQSGVRLRDRLVAEHYEK